MKVTVAAFRLRRRWLVAALVVVLVGAGYGVRSWAVRRPDAAATLIAGPLAPDLAGRIVFRDVPGGVEVTADVTGLPAYDPGPPPTGPHGFHIHEGTNCEVGDPANPFMAAGGHWNPDNQPHGNHAGDFPVLFSQGGRARMSFVTDRFTAADIVGRTVIIHMQPDDYRTQPAGDAGLRLACGVIVRYAR